MHINNILGLVFDWLRLNSRGIFKAFPMGSCKIVKEVTPFLSLLYSFMLYIQQPASPPKAGSQISLFLLSLSAHSQNEQGILYEGRGTFEEELEVRVILKRMNQEFQYFKNPMRYVGEMGRKRGFSGSPNHIRKEWLLVRPNKKYPRLLPLGISGFLLLLSGLY